MFSGQCTHSKFLLWVRKLALQEDHDTLGWVCQGALSAWVLCKLKHLLVSLFYSTSSEAQLLRRVGT